MEDRQKPMPKPSTRNSKRRSAKPEPENETIRHPMTSKVLFVYSFAIHLALSILAGVLITMVSLAEMDGVQPSDANFVNFCVAILQIFSFPFLLLLLHFNTEFVSIHPAQTALHILLIPTDSAIVALIIVLTRNKIAQFRVSRSSEKSITPV